MRGKKQERAQETENEEEDGREAAQIGNMALSFGVSYLGLQRQADIWRAQYC